MAGAGSTTRPGSGRSGVDCAHETTKGRKGAARGRARRAGRASRQVGLRRNRESAKARTTKTTKGPARAAAPACPAEFDELFVGSLHARANGAHTKAHKNKRSEPTTDSEPARKRNVSRLSLFFRAFAILPALTPPARLARHTGVALRTAPLRPFLLSCAAVQPVWEGKRRWTREDVTVFRPFPASWS